MAEHAITRYLLIGSAAIGSVGVVLGASHLSVTSAIIPPEALPQPQADTFASTVANTLLEHWTTSSWQRLGACFAAKAQITYVDGEQSIPTGFDGFLRERQRWNARYDSLQGQVTGISSTPGTALTSIHATWTVTGSADQHTDIITGSWAITLNTANTAQPIIQLTWHHHIAPLTPAP